MNFTLDANSIILLAISGSIGLAIKLVLGKISSIHTDAMNQFRELRQDVRDVGKKFDAHLANHSRGDLERR